MPDVRLASLDDVVLTPPLPAAVTLSLIVSIWAISSALSRRMFGDRRSGVHVAGCFILITAVAGGIAHVVAIAGVALIPAMRCLAALIVLSGLACLRSLIRDLRAAVQAIDLVWRHSASALARWQLALSALVLIALAAAALGPVTDGDSLYSHVAIALDWLRHGGAYPRPDWFIARTAGIGEAISCLGLACGTDGLAAGFQFSGVVVAILTLIHASSSARARTDDVAIDKNEFLPIAALFVAACPVLLSLVPNQKFQLLPAAAMVLALVLLLDRFSSLDIPTTIVVSSAIALPMASKYSFLITGAAMTAFLLVAGFRSRRALRTLIIAAIVIGGSLAPQLVRNWSYYGDPLSPFFEKWSVAPDRSLLWYANYVRFSSGSWTLSRLLELPAELVVPLDTARSVVLGFGIIALAVIWGGGQRARVFGVASITAAALLLAISHISPRYLLESYFLAGAALVQPFHNRAKRWLVFVLTLQLAGVSLFALDYAWRLTPGALTSMKRLQVMTRYAAGTAEGRWLAAQIPPGAPFLSEIRSFAVLPPRFVVDDPARFAPSPDEQRENLLKLARDYRIEYFVHGGLYKPLIDCGSVRVAAATFPIPVRNRLTPAQTYRFVLYRLAGNCRGQAPFGKSAASSESNSGSLSRRPADR
jgi:Protein of unknown function (DUF1420)